MAKSASGRSPKQPVGFDIGFGRPPVPDRDAAAQALRDSMDHALGNADATHENLAASLRSKLAGTSSQAELINAGLTSAVRQPISDASAAAQNALQAARNTLEAHLAGQTAAAFSQGRAVSPQVPTFDQAVAAAYGQGVVAPTVQPLSGSSSGMPTGSWDASGNYTPPPSVPTGGWTQPIAPSPFAPPPTAQPPSSLPPGFNPDDPSTWPPIGTIPNDPRVPPSRPTPPLPLPPTPVQNPPVETPPNWTNPVTGLPLPGMPPPVYGEDPRNTPTKHYPITCPPGSYPLYIDGPCVPGPYPNYPVPCQPGWEIDYDAGGGYCRPKRPDVPAPPTAPPTNPPAQPPSNPVTPPPASCPPCATTPPADPTEPKHPPGKVAADKCVKIPPAELIGVGGIANVLSWLLGLTDKEQKPVTPTWLKSADIGWFTLGSFIAGAMRWFGGHGLYQLQETVKAINCGGSQQGDLQGDMALLGLVAKYTGIMPLPVIRPMQQQSAYLCPTELLSVAEADAAYLAKQISKDEWECYIRAANVKHEDHEHVLQAGRNRLTALDYLNLHRRDEITEKEFKDAIRSLGYLDDEVPGQITELGKQLPALGDIIRFLMRDVADEQLVAKFGMDDEFKQKWTGPLIEWAKAQGVPDEVAKAAWRAHWSIPAPGQLYTMYHRFKNLPDGDPRKTTRDDVETALKQNDNLPFWIPRLMGIADHQINPSDAYKARQVGTIDHQELVSILEENGYSERDAARVADAWEAQIILQHERLPMARLYMQWAASRDDLQDALLKRGVRGEDIATIFERLDARRNATRRRLCQRGQKKRWMAGEWTYSEAVAYLIQDGLDQGTASQLVEVWKCERANKGKHFSAGTLCSLLDAGLINEAEMFKRLINMDWGDEEASLLVSQCSRRIALKRSAAEAKQLQAEIRDAKSAAQRTQSEEKKRQADQAKGAARIAKCNQAREAKERNILTAGAKLAEKLSIEFYDGVEMVRGEVRQLALTSPSDEISLAAAAVIIARSSTVDSAETFHHQLELYAESGRHVAAVCAELGIDT